MDEVAVTLNGTNIRGRRGMTILELAREQGVDMPTLCYSPDLAPLGACRLCVVEVDGSRTLVASCHTELAPNMVVQTHSPKVLAARKVTVELLLASHPDFCLVCDKANRCELRKIAADLGVGLPRFKAPKRFYQIEEVGRHLVRDMSKCVLCRRCVRACEEIKKEGILAIGYRGFGCKVVFDLDKPLDADVCASCDACVSACPVGALAKREQRFASQQGPALLLVGQGRKG